MAAGDAKPCGKGSVSPFHQGLLLESAQAISFSFIATFGLDTQITKLNVAKRAMLYKLPWI